MTPKIVKNAVSPTGQKRAVIDSKPVRVVGTQTAVALRSMMEAVATEQGTAASAAIDGYRVSGKTGTGKRVLDNHYASGNVTSFVGMAPADSPRYVVSVFLHVPDGVGGAIAGPVFHQLMNFVLLHNAVPPSTGKAPAVRIYA